MARRPRLGDLLPALGLLALALAVLALLHWGRPKRFTERIATGPNREVSFDMVLIPGGTFRMGSPPTEAGRRDDEGPQHQVEISSFYLSTTEVTLELFTAYYDEKHPISQCWAKRDMDNLDLESIYEVDAVTRATDVLRCATWHWVQSTQQPIIGVTWAQAVEFCRWLRLKTGRPYRLPSEAEWEYACRAGSKAAYCSGDDAAKLEDYGWSEDNSDDRPHCVKLKKPNAWGLYDMHGNVLEWCHDLYDPAVYGARAQTGAARNPFGPGGRAVPEPEALGTPGAPQHVVRGGSGLDPAEELRSAARAHEEPSWRARDPVLPKSWWWLRGGRLVGFRVACDAGRR